MPIYAYKCASCGHAKDVLQKLSDAPLSVCPACGAETFLKQVTAAGFQLKGSGWYATDFKGGSSSAPPAAEGEKGEKTEKGEKGDGAKTAEAGKAPAEGAKAPAGGEAKAPAKAAKPESGSSASKPDAPAP